MRRALLLVCLVLPGILWAQAPTLTVQLSHSVRALAAVPGSPYLASVGDNSVIVWDTEFQRLLRTWVAHPDRVLALAVRPDGAQLATGGADRTIKLWSMEGKLLRTLRGPKAAVYGLSYSPDGTKLLVAIQDGSVVLLDLASGRPVHTLAGHRGGAFAVAYNPDGKLALSGGEDGVVRIWDLTTGAEKTSFRGHFESVISVAWHPDGQRFASGGTDRIVRLWSLAEQAPIRTLQGHSRIIQAVAFNGEGSLLASGGGDDQTGEVLLWNAADGTQEGNLRGHTALVYGLGFDTNDRLYSGGFDTAIRVWDTQPPALAFVLSGVAEPVYQLAYARNAAVLALLTNDRVVVRDATTGRPVGGYAIEGRSLALSPNGRTVAVGDYQGNITVLDTRSGEVLMTLGGHSGPVLQVTFGTNSNLLYSAGADGTVRNYALSEKKQVRSFATGGAPVVALAVSPTGGTVAGATQDGGLLLWSNKTTERIGQVALPSPGRSVAISPDGARLAVGCTDGRILLFDAKTGSLSRELTGHTDPVTALAFHPGGVALASACGAFSGFSDRSIRVWDATRGETTHTVEGHRGRVYTLGYSPDGRILASGSEDSQCKLWETGSYQELLSLALFPKSRDYVMVSPDGYFYGTDRGLEQGIYYVQGNTILTLSQFYQTYFAPNLWESRVLGKPIEFEQLTTVAEVTVAVPDSPPPPDPAPVTDPEVVEVPATPVVTTPPPPPPAPITTAFKPVPTVAITNPQNGQVYLDKAEIKVAVEATDMGGGIGEIRLYINGKAFVPEERGITTAQFTIGQKTQRIFPIKLAAGLNELKAVALSAENVESAPTTIYVQLQGPEPKASLFVLSMGLNKYKNEQYNLNYGVPDAQALAKAVELAGEGVFDKVVVTELYDEKATRAGVEAVLNDFIVRSKPEDVFVFFYAGHGVMGYRTPDEGDFFLVLYDVVKMAGNDELLNRAGLSATVLKEYLAKIPAQKQVLLLDACQSGGAVTTFSARGAAEEKAIAQLGRSTGMVVLAATASDQFAYEFGQLGHGAFTYSLLEGLKGGADGGRKDGAITVNELKVYVEDLVPEMTQKIKGKAQYPNSFGSGQDFPLGTVKQ